MNARDTRVRRVDDLPGLLALQADWDRLCGQVPFCRFEWNHGWWRHYQDEGELYVLVVEDDSGQVVGIAPWYLKRSTSRGRVLCFMASGEVCSDYQAVFAADGRERDVAIALANWLSDVRGSLSEWVTREDRDRWDLIEWECVPHFDSTLRELARQLKLRGAGVYHRPSESCWRLDLDCTWPEYEARLSKSHRKQVRRSQRTFLDTGRAVLHTASEPDDLPLGMEHLIQLHQRRWNDRGEHGVFASRRFTEFHQEMMQEFLALGLLRLHWLEVDGAPVAAEYALAGNDTIYLYQAGVEPAQLDIEPGRISTIATLHAAKEEGMVAFDFLRGNESYKAHWRANEVPCSEMRIVARRPASMFRNHVWLAGGRVKRMLSRGPADAHGHAGAELSRDWRRLTATDLNEFASTGFSGPPVTH